MIDEDEITPDDIIKGYNLKVLNKDYDELAYNHKPYLRIKITKWDYGSERIRY